MRKSGTGRPSLQEPCREMENIMEEQNALIEQSSQILNLFDNIQDTKENELIDAFADIGFPPDKKDSLDLTQACFFRVSQLSFDKDYPHREAFENVLASLDNPAFNFVYILSGSGSGIDLYIGVVKNANESQNREGECMSAKDYGPIIRNAFEGNFNGSTLEIIKSNELKNIIFNGAQLYENEGGLNAGLLLGIPTMNKKEDGDGQDFQGIDRLINSMLGLEWRLVVVCEPVERSEILALQSGVYDLYNRLSVISKLTVNQTMTDGESVSVGTSDSTNRTVGYNKSTSHGTSHGRNSEHTSSGTNESRSEGTNESTSKTYGKSENYSTNKGSSSAVTVELANKHAQDLMKYIDEELLERIKLGLGKGLFKNSVYYMAKNPADAERLKVGLMSLFQGNKATYSPLVARRLKKAYAESYAVLQTYQNQYESKENMNPDASLLLSRPEMEMGSGLCTYLTAPEVSLLAGLPQTEVPGISLKEIVDFGLNEKAIKEDDDGILLGYMVQRGRDLANIPFMLSRRSMAKHTFIAGVTGSGKTTTCHKLLSEANMPFLVIEPAKTEYRTLIQTKDKDGKLLFDDIVVFTLGNETLAPFRINPFELIKGEVISSHIDMVKATFTSAFPMEASMPQILEEAIYKCYEKKGWNIDTNENDLYGESAFDADKDCFPILSELLLELNKVVDEKGFDTRLASDYKGSLVSRLSNLTVGSKGALLNCEHSTDFDYIATHNVILEMEELKSPEDKALLMGFVLARLSAVIKAKHKADVNFKHLTLIEEAHRLLSKVEYGDPGAKKGAVETFTDLLAEVRKYGEGLIVVDQIPNKLAPEVLKNTNTKIIHKILAKDDKESVGDCMLMDDKQKEYLSALETGNAIVFNEHTQKPVHIKIVAVSDTNEEEISEDVVTERFKEKRSELGSCYEDLEVLPIYKLYDEVARGISNMSPDAESCEKLRKEISRIAENKGFERKNIYETLLRRRYLLTGKFLENAKSIEKQMSELVDFFATVFDKEDFTKDSISGHITDLL